MCSFEIQVLTLIVSYFSSALFFARDLRGPAPEKEKGECSVKRRGLRWRMRQRMRWMDEENMEREREEMERGRERERERE